MHRLTPIALATATLLASGCGEKDDATADATPTTPAATSTAAPSTTTPPTSDESRVPAGCKINAQGAILKVDRQAGVGVISAGDLGDDVRFDPKTDVKAGRARAGASVFFQSKKTAAGPTATCVLVQKDG